MTLRYLLEKDGNVSLFDTLRELLQGVGPIVPAGTKVHAVHELRGDGRVMKIGAVVDAMCKECDQLYHGIYAPIRNPPPFRCPACNQFFSGDEFLLEVSRWRQSVGAEPIGYLKQPPPEPDSPSDGACCEGLAEAGILRKLRTAAALLSQVQTQIEAHRCTCGRGETPDCCRGDT